MFVQEQLESFRRTCEDDFERMETLEQVRSLRQNATPKTSNGLSTDAYDRISRSNFRVKSRTT